MKLSLYLRSLCLVLLSLGGCATPALCQTTYTAVPLAYAGNKQPFIDFFLSAQTQTQRILWIGHSRVDSNTSNGVRVAGTINAAFARKQASNSPESDLLTNYAQQCKWLGWSGAVEPGDHGTPTGGGIDAALTYYTTPVLNYGSGRNLDGAVQSGTLTGTNKLTAGVSPQNLLAPAHGLATGDVVALFNLPTTNPVGRYPGAFTITKIDANNFTIPTAVTLVADVTSGNWRTAAAGDWSPSQTFTNCITGLFPRGMSDCRVWPSNAAYQYRGLQVIATPTNYFWSLAAGSSNNPDCGIDGTAWMDQSAGFVVEVCAVTDPTSSGEVFWKAWDRAADHPNANGAALAQTGINDGGIYQFGTGTGVITSGTTTAGSWGTYTNGVWTADASGLQRAGGKTFVTFRTPVITLSSGSPRTLLFECCGSDSAKLTTIVWARIRGVAKPRGVVVNALGHGTWSCQDYATFNPSFASSIKAIGATMVMIQCDVNNASGSSAGTISGTPDTEAAFRGYMQTLITNVRSALGASIPIILVADFDRERNTSGSNFTSTQNTRFGDYPGEEYAIAQADSGVLFLNLRRSAEERYGVKSGVAAYSTSIPAATNLSAFIFDGSSHVSATGAVGHANLIVDGIWDYLDMDALLARVPLRNRNQRRKSGRARPHVRTRPIVAAGKKVLR